MALHLVRAEMVTVRLLVPCFVMPGVKDAHLLSLWQDLLGGESAHPLLPRFPLLRWCTARFQAVEGRASDHLGAVESVANFRGALCGLLCVLEIS